MIETVSRCAFSLIGLIVVSIFCIQSWATWSDFREEDEAHHHNPFMNILISIIIALAILNWRLVLALIKILFEMMKVAATMMKGMGEVARGTGPISAAASAYMILLIAFWVHFSNNWEKKKKKKEYMDATWQFAVAGIVTPILAILIAVGAKYTGGKIC